MKYAYRIIFIILLVALVVNIILFFTWSDMPIDDVYVINPQLENMRVTTKLYFIYDDQLHSETRTITVRNEAFEESIFEELLIGPKTKAFAPALPDNIEVISFEVSEDVIYLNLDRELLTSDQFTDENFSLHLQAIVNTLSELRHQLKVQFLVDGERISEPVHGVSLMEPIKRDERVNYQRDTSSADVAIAFIEQVFNRRFDLAYQELDDHSKATYPFAVFQELMEGYIYYHQGYQRNIYFTQNYEVYDIVTVKYVEINSNEATPREMTEQWKVIKNGDAFKIDITETIRP